MDEKKPTATKKSASSSTATKRTYTKKAVPAVEKPKAVVAAKSEELAAGPFITEEPVKKAIDKKQEPVFVEPDPYELVPVLIPLDPSLATTDQLFEGHLNGKFFAYKRGATHMVERYLAEHINRRFAYSEQAIKNIEEFKRRGL